MDCAFNLYCDPDTMMCANSIAEGSSCNSTFADPCQVGTVCGYSGTCIKLFSQAAGASCNTYQECNIGKSKIRNHFKIHFSLKIHMLF